jgi:translation initiation factor 3 subunit E
MGSEGGIEQWDLTSKVSPYLDRHMVFPLLEYLDTLISKGSISYSSKDVSEARLSLLRPTHMVDYAIDVYKSIHGESAEVPKEMEEQKEKVYQELESLRQACAPLDKLVKDEEQRVSTREEPLKNLPLLVLCLT